MSKLTFEKPGTMLYPVPAILVTCGDETEQNVLTIAWAGTINSEPPMVSISVRKSRYSHQLISRTGEFVINLTTKELAYATDFCGVKSGRDLDKFQATGITKLPASKVRCPMIKESPVNLECKVKTTIVLPSHDVFLAEVIAVHAEEDLLNEAGKLELERANLLCYSHGSYHLMSEQSLGRFGFSVMKPKTKKRVRPHSANRKRS